MNTESGILNQKANRKWENKNPEKTKHDTARRQARRYINAFATDEDLDELVQWIEEKREQK